MSDPDYKELDCDTCQDHEVYNPEFRNCKIFNLEGQGNGFTWHGKYTPEELNSCPKSVVACMDDFVLDTVNVFYDCQNFKTMPRAGGLYDQDALTMKLWNIIMKAQADIDKMDEQEREAKRGSS